LISVYFNKLYVIELAQASPISLNAIVVVQVLEHMPFIVIVSQNIYDRNYVYSNL